MINTKSLYHKKQNIFLPKIPMTSISSTGDFGEDGLLLMEGPGLKLSLLDRLFFPLSFPS